MAHGLNANLVHKWRRQAGAQARRCRRRQMTTFIPVTMHLRRSAVAHDIRDRTAPRRMAVNVTWPLAASAQCAAWLRELLQVIRVDAVWLAVEPLDMRAGTEAALARVVSVFGAAHPHHAYLFANRRANRMKVLVHDGIGVWLAARRLNQGKFVWPKDAGATLTLTRAQLDALVLGLPWQRIGEAGVITRAVERASRAIADSADAQRARHRHDHAP